MRAVRVVVPDVPGEHGFEVTSSQDEHLVEAFAPNGGTRSVMGLARGARTEILRIMMPPTVKTASKDDVNLVPRSRIRNLTACSASSIEMLRACWVTQSVTGLVVTSAIRTRRVSWWMKTST